MSNIPQSSLPPANAASGMLDGARLADQQLDAQRAVWFQPEQNNSALLQANPPASFSSMTPDQLAAEVLNHLGS